VDVCVFTQGRKKVYFVNLAGVGFVTDVAKTARKFKIFRDFSYLIGVFARTINLKFHHMELEIDGKIFSGDNCFVEFCNSRFTGGKMLMAPNAQIDDGFMDIVVAEKLSRTSLMAALPKIFRGTHIHHPAVRCFKARQAVIKTRPPKSLLPDGEIMGTTPTTVTVLPKLIRYLQ
jgi:diacylglycerol kinase family enzyme